MILGVDTPLDIHVGAVISQAGKLLALTLFKQINLVIWNYFIGHVLLGSSNEQASKEPVLMERH